MYFHHAITGKHPPIMKRFFLLLLSLSQAKLKLVWDSLPNEINISRSPKGYSSDFVKPFNGNTLLVLQVCWKFPTAWSEKPNHQRIDPRKYFKTILFINNFQIKIRVYVTIVVKSHTGLGVVCFSFNLAKEMVIFLNPLVKPL